MLVNGKILAGQVCPLLAQCNLCPTPLHLKNTDFSCGFARGYELLKGE